MGSALETLCGQAVGAGQLHMLGIYMQRSWVISGVTALVLSPVYVFTTPILKLLRQSEAISEVAGKYTTCSLPQLYAYAMNFPLQKFFQSQSKVWVMAMISVVVLGIHALLNWIFITKLGYGLLAAALVGNVSWWLLNLGQMIYLVSGFFPEAWTGFSMSAFQNLAAFVKLSLASAVMLCMNYQLWILMIALGLNAAVSVRVSNELGANHPKAAKFSVIISVSTSLFFGFIFMAVVLIFRKEIPKVFTDAPELMREASKLGYLLGATILLSSVQPVLSGVATGAGWQTLVAFINTGCYYLVGLPIGAVLGFKLKLNELGIWLGLLIGTLLQTIFLILITFRTKWEKEAMQAEQRIRTWGGQHESQSASCEQEA